MKEIKFFLKWGIRESSFSYYKFFILLNKVFPTYWIKALEHIAIHFIKYKELIKFKKSIPMKIIIWEDASPIKFTIRYLLKDKRVSELLNVKFLFNKKEQPLPIE